jgi:two-component sensor histidine kinase
MLRNGYVDDFQAKLKHKNGRVVWVSTSAQLLRDEDGNPAGVEGIARNITERKRAEDHVKASLEEKEVLLREIHHRVKNNLAVINSLVRLQSRRTKDETHRTMFEDTNKRIMSMTLAHDLLYRSKNLANISIGEYITKLVDHLVASSLVLGDSISVKKEIKDVSLSLDTAVPLGFLLTELVTNCLKHAFPAIRRGKITISLLTADEKKFELVVADNGIGIPEGTDLTNTTSLGLSLVSTYVKQLDGEIEIIRGNGTEVRIRFGELKK